MGNRITISPEHKKQLQEEFKTSETSVRYSLNYSWNSAQAKAIRKRAKELLLKEANRIAE